MKKRNKKTEYDIKEIQALDSTISEVQANISQLKIIKKYQIKRQEDVEYLLDN
jgi:hypothetical protein